MTEKVTGDWIAILMESEGKYISLETSDGLLREGRISGFRYREFKFNGSTVKIPTEVELNGDVNDRVPLARVALLDIT